MASVDSVFVSNQVLEAPVSDKPLGPTTFVDVVHVSGYEANGVSNGPGGSEYYLAESTRATTIPFRTSTVTVIPFTLSSHLAQGAQVNASASLSGTSVSPSGGSSTSSPVVSGYAWSVTAANGSTPAGTAPSPSFAPMTSETNVQPASTQFGLTSTVTQISTVYATWPATSADGNNTTVMSGGDLEKRQTCTWISAVVGGQTVGWCNNWGGLSTLTDTSWITTGMSIYGVIFCTVVLTAHKSFLAISPALVRSLIQAHLQQQPQPRQLRQLPRQLFHVGVTGPFQIGVCDLSMTCRMN